MQQKEVAEYEARNLENVYQQEHLSRTRNVLQKVKKRILENTNGIKEFHVGTTRRKARQ